MHTRHTTHRAQQQWYNSKLYEDVKGKEQFNSTWYCSTGVGQALVPALSHAPGRDRDVS